KWTYLEIESLSNRVANALRTAGVGAGDRVAIWLPKSGLAVAAMQGVLKMGAAYVPVDPLSPAARARLIMADCGIKALVSTTENAASVGLDGVPCVDEAT